MPPRGSDVDAPTQWSLTERTLFAGLRPQPNGEPASPLEAISLIARYCERKGVRREYGLEDQLRRLRTHEPVLYLSRKRYRDHLYHSCRIALLGEALLNGNIWPTVGGNGNDKTAKPFTLLDVAAELCKQNPWYNGVFQREKVEDKDVSQLLLRSWFIASLMHDVAFVFETYLQLKENISFLQDFRPIKDFLERTELNLSKLREDLRIQDLVPKDQVVSTSDVTHSEIGASYIHSLSGSRKDPVLDIAARTAYLHDVHAPIEFSEEPLAYLLALIDQIQDWRRPVSQSEMLMKLLDIQHGFDVTGIAAKTLYELENASIQSYRPDCYEWKTTDGKIKVHFTLDYGDRAEALHGTEYNFPLAFHSRCRAFRNLRIGNDTKVRETIGKLQGSPSFGLDVKVTLKATGKLGHEWNRQAKIMHFKTKGSHPVCHQWIESLISTPGFRYDHQEIVIDLNSIPDAPCEDDVLKQSYESYRLDKQIRDLRVEEKITYTRKGSDQVNSRSFFSRLWENASQPHQEIPEAFITLGDIHPEDLNLERVRALIDKKWVDIRDSVHEVRLPKNLGAEPLDSVALIFPFKKFTSHQTGLAEKIEVQYCYDLVLPVTDLGSDYFMNMKSQSIEELSFEVAFNEALFNEYFQGGHYLVAELKDWTDPEKLYQKARGREGSYIKRTKRDIAGDVPPDTFVPVSRARRRGSGKNREVVFSHQFGGIKPYHAAGWVWLPK